MSFKKEGEIGSDNFILGYYHRGESSLFGDLFNYGSPVLEFSWPVTEQDPGRAVPYLKTFIGVLELVAKGEDRSYSKRVRARIKTLIENHKWEIEHFKSMYTHTADDLLQLRPLTVEFQDYLIQRMEEKNS